MNRRERLSEHPELMRQWDDIKNTSDPFRLTAGSGIIAWWICDERHSWKAAIRSRSNGSGCLYCVGKKVLPGFNDLQTCSPEIANDWDYERNKLTPLHYTRGSRASVWWTCAKGHSWKAAVSDRFKGTGCPVCAGKKVLPGFNDLQTLNPKLADEWDYAKNTFSPSQVSPGSGKIAWWLCKKGHSWKAMIISRSKGCGCPYCSGTKVFAGFNDLQTLNPGLSGEWNFDKNAFAPNQVTANSNIAVWWNCIKGHTWKAPIAKRNIGTGCPYCAGQRVLKGFNDLQTLNPTLANEWDYEKNTLEPSQVTPNSNKTVWWKCAKGHSWRAKIYARNKGTGCPYCSNQKVLKGFNDLQTQNPKLAQWWDSEKNVLNPSEVTPSSPQKAWWKCEKGHSWETQISDRKKGRGCPFCTGRLVLAGFNDLQTLKPELISEWDFGKNCFEPSKVSVASSKSVWWKCAKGHSWKTTINHRNHSHGCPYCSGEKVLPGFNDLETLRPDLASEWCVEKNLLMPSQVAVASNNAVWWNCRENHCWKATVASRSGQGAGCPFCIGKTPYTPRCVR